MPKKHIKQSYDFTAKQMFDVVADIEEYPKFLPSCNGLKIKEEYVDDDGNQILIADMSVGYQLYREVFKTKVELKNKSMEIIVEYLDGPFEYLNNYWKFNDTEDNMCEVEFFIDFKLKNNGLSFFINSMVQQFYNKILNAFKKRAETLYS